MDGGRQSFSRRIRSDLQTISALSMHALTFAFAQDAPRPADLLSPAQRQAFHPDAKVWEKGGPVKRLPTPKVSCGTIPNNQSTRDWIRQHPGCWKPSLPGASLKLEGTRRKTRTSESIVFNCQ